MKKYIGFTLLEMLLALSVAAVIIAMAVRYFPIAEQSAQLNNTVKQVTLLLKESHEWLSGRSQETFNGGTTASTLSTANLISSGLVTTQNTQAFNGETIEISPSSVNPSHIQVSLLIAGKTACCQLAGRLHRFMLNTSNTICKASGSTQCNTTPRKFVGDF